MLALVLVFVLIVVCVGIVHRSRLLDWNKSCCFIERYSPFNLFEPASGVIRILQQSTTNIKLIEVDFIDAVAKATFLLISYMIFKMILIL